jgi:dienelactone hydrolase
MERLEVREDGLVADLFYGESEMPRPAIIMIGGSEGGRMWSRPKKLLSALVGHGYNVLSLAYFKEPGLPDSLEEIPLEYFEKAFAWLGRQPDTIAEFYGLIGGSKGAEIALLLATRYPQVKLVVALSPSSVVWSGIPKNRFNLSSAPKSSWSFGGEGLPFLPVAFSRSDWWSLLTLRLKDKSVEALRNTELVNAARIPVENGQCPILLLSGRRDQVWPSTMMSEQIVNQLDKAAYGYSYEHLALDTGHVWLARKRECWLKTFTFLERNFEPVANSA